VRRDGQGARGKEQGARGKAEGATSEEGVRREGDGQGATSEEVVRRDGEKFREDGTAEDREGGLAFAPWRE
jgi:hypothetical protein